MKVNRKVVLSATITTAIIAAVAAFVVRRKKVAEARGYVPIGNSVEDRQLDWGGWPGGLSI